MLEITGDRREFLNEPISQVEAHALRRHGHTGRPLGEDTFVARLEKSLGRSLRPRKRGRKGKASGN